MKTHSRDQASKTYLMNFWRTLVMIFAEKAILLLGSLKVRALCAMYLASQTNAERRLRMGRGWIRVRLRSDNLMGGREPVGPTCRTCAAVAA